MFIAIKGTQVDGHDYIAKAIELGANVIVCENLPEIKDGLTYILVDNSSKVLGQMASNYYDTPSSKLNWLV